MSSTLHLSILPATLLALVVGAPTASLAAPNCAERLLPHEARACAAAREGENELRHFVQRTRTMYQLSFYDYAHEVPSSRKVSGAHADKAPAQRVAGLDATTAR